MELEIRLAESAKPLVDPCQLGFGRLFTDHMFNMDYSPDKGWHNPRIEPYAPLTLDPATMVLHYGQAIFEGLKAYRTPTGAVQLFRPQDNLARLNRSARRVSIPEFDEALVLHALKELVRIEERWVPDAPGTALYIRPAIIATDPMLGLRASHTYRFFIILSPVAGYCSDNLSPTKVWVSTEQVRAVRGGLGAAKTAANYAASIQAGEEAQRQGYAMVLWLDGVERRYVEEAGAMNIFFVIGGQLVTPSLQGSILAGITRDSLITLARLLKIPVAERPISIDELLAAHRSGALEEMFACGTAAVVSPVGELKCGDQVLTIGDGQAGPITCRLYQALTDIQYGRTEDPMGWIVPVTEAQPELEPAAQAPAS